MNQGNPVYEICKALTRQHGNCVTPYRTAAVISEKTAISPHRAAAIIAGHESPTLDELADLAEMAGLKVEVVVTMPKESREVAA